MRTTATPTTTAASRATLRRGARMAHGGSTSLPGPSANARNSAVLAEMSGLARNSPVVLGRPVPAEGFTSCSDMASTVADQGSVKCKVSRDPVETSQTMRMCPAPVPALAARAWRHAVRPADQPGKDNHAAGAHHEGLRADPLHHLLEMPHVGRPDVQQGVGLAGHRAG